MAMRGLARRPVRSALGRNRHLRAAEVGSSVNDTGRDRALRGANAQGAADSQSALPRRHPALPDPARYLATVLDQVLAGPVAMPNP